MIKNLYSILLFVFLLSSCNILQKSAKNELTDGFYRKITDSERQKVYVNVMDESIFIYPTTKEDKITAIDTLQAFELQLPEYKNKESFEFSLSQSSFDVDFLTVPAKFRLPAGDVPAQLNSELNGSLFLGYRTDRYNIKNKVNSFNIQEQSITHLGYSVGLFTGIGNTFMSPTTTNDRLVQEYDGIVWSKGLAVIIGLNNFSVGLALGFDNLLDRNRSIWVYENKPWAGFAFGLNLN